MLRSRFFLGLFVAALFLGGRCLAETWNNCQVVAAALAEDDLVLLLETSHYNAPWYSHTFTQSGVEYYYTKTRLREQASSRPATRIVGPLWPPGEKAGALKYGGGLADRHQALLCPDGKLLSFIKSGSGGVRKELKIDVKQAKWLTVGSAALVPSVPEGSYQKPRFQTLTGSILVQRETDSKVRSYELERGIMFEDEWLASTLQFWLYNSGLQLADISATDDLKYVICWPTAFFKPDGAPAVRSFNIDGTTYPRNSYALYFERPDPRPRMLNKLRDSSEERESSSNTPYRGGFSIDEKLFILYAYAGQLKLAEADGAEKYQIATSLDVNINGQVQHDTKRDELVFFRWKINEPLEITVWSYKQKKITTLLCDYPALFRRGLLGTLKPVSSIPVLN